MVSLTDPINYEWTDGSVTDLSFQWSIVAPSTHTVTFDPRNGNVPTNVTVTAGQPITAPTTPALTGYDFVGWYTEATGINAWDFDTPITADITFYAKWKLKTVGIDAT